ncbi:MAG TPA: bacillithiol biosynthesis deacetylase BshB1 [Pirellulaceae bacterium]|nr:bacillithiol biosynthesis deacetylase BshB1 [Pirellulaceae bacterium]HMO93474.1 bacillithiol biosynthesis deacetylase BshB1 [Pirellulaceae bacterium]HMP69211.1 bacillithiol biosynthesis deacetylase BshB1 [Pirellulaceae bacterium]
MKLHALVIAPHPDDAELGMGGSIVKMLQGGWNVGILDLTDGEPTPFGTRELRTAETAKASQHLGLRWRENLGLPNRSLQHTLEARAKLAEVIRRTQPNWLFAPFWEDAHPDHVAATELIEAARFWAKLTKTDMSGEPWHPQRIFHYYCIHLRQIAQPAFIVDISQEWPKKLAAIAAYESQFVTGRDHVSPSFLERLEHEASFWGGRIGTKYGEPFASREPIGLRAFSELA